MSDHKVSALGKSCVFAVCRCICEHNHIDTKYKITPVVIVSHDRCPVTGHGSLGPKTPEEKAT